jgi:hypothetical protein
MRDERLDSSAHDSLAEYRNRLAAEEYDRVERKRLGLAEQYSLHNSADARIRAWEKAHHLRMPSDPSHAVLEVIAFATQLTLAEVRDQQQVRAGQVRQSKG